MKAERRPPWHINWDSAAEGTLADAIHKAFLIYFKTKTPEILAPAKPK